MSGIFDNKEKEEAIETLVNLGLNGKESRVYFSLLQSGEVGVSAISADTKLHRQFIYDTLLSLEEKGLVGHVIVRGRKRFFTYSPEKLSHMFEYKKKMAEDFAIRVQKKLLPSDINQFEVYRGQEAFIANELDIVSSIRPNSKIYIFGSTVNEYEKSMGKYLTQYDFLRIKKGVEILYLGDPTQSGFLPERKDSRNLFSYRLLPKSLSGALSITIYEDRVCIYMFGSPVANFTIKSETIAKSYTDFFLGLWQMSK
jgi:sugar-specific transcriptional regulator TrmB